MHTEILLSFYKIDCILNNIMAIAITDYALLDYMP